MPAAATSKKTSGIVTDAEKTLVDDERTEVDDECTVVDDDDRTQVDPEATEVDGENETALKTDSRVSFQQAVYPGVSQVFFWMQDRISIVSVQHCIIC